LVAVTYRTLRLPRKHRQVLGADLNRSESVEVHGTGRIGELMEIARKDGRLKRGKKDNWVRRRPNSNARRAFHADRAG
jgi:hypothetical protein